ncbi:MAG: ATP-binding protein [Planctomycetota bacterium]|nr:ATP-binding protein [Planctomycetota bacterium]
MGKVLLSEALGDDEKIERALMAAGHEVVAAARGTSLLDVARREQPDVVVLEEPGGEVREVCAALEDEDSSSHVPVLVVCVGDGGPADRATPRERVAELLEMGAFDCVEPPLEETLGARIAVAVRSKLQVDACRKKIRSLEKARGAAEHSSRAKSDFLASVSHEIRTPLTSVLGYADLLLDPRSGETERADWVQTIRKSGEHLMNVLDGLLDIAKIESGKMTVEAVRTCPRTIVAEVISLLRPRAEEKNIAFEVAIEGEIPATIETDPTRVRQILINLVGNAIKFTTKGSVRLACRMFPATDAGGPFLGFEVADTGIGMSEEQCRRLFVPFRQVDESTNRRFGGTGLGLTIAKRLAELLGGDVTFESTKGKGSTFLAFVPTGSLDGVEMVSDFVTRLEGRGSANRREVDADLDGRVLLAEDFPANQRLFLHYLEAVGLQPVLARDGAETLAKVRESVAEGRPFDLIVMDMQMPNVDGYTAASQLRQDGYEGPILALTAHAMRGQREKCLKAGCTDFATKPIARETLVALLEKHLPRQADRRPAAAAPPETTGGDASTPAESAGAGAQATEAAGRLHSEVLEAIEDPELIRLVESFLSSLPGKLGEIEKMLVSGDRVSVARSAHQLKGAAGGYGYPAMGEKADELERLAAGTGDRETMRCLVADLVALANRSAALPEDR